MRPDGYTYKSEFARKHFREGQEEALRKVLLRQLTHRFGDVSAPVAARIAAAEMEDLERWVDRVLVAESVDAVLIPGG
jgi:hypothetical protein